MNPWHPFFESDIFLKFIEIGIRNKQPVPIGILYHEMVYIVLFDLDLFDSEVLPYAVVDMYDVVANLYVDEVVDRGYFTGGGRCFLYPPLGYPPYWQYDGYIVFLDRFIGKRIKAPYLFYPLLAYFYAQRVFESRRIYGKTVSQSGKISLLHDPLAGAVAVLDKLSGKVLKVYLFVQIYLY